MEKGREVLIKPSFICIVDEDTGNSFYTFFNTSSTTMVFVQYIISHLMHPILTMHSFKCFVEEHFNCFITRVIYTIVLLFTFVGFS